MTVYAMHSGQDRILIGEVVAGNRSTAIFGSGVVAYLNDLAVVANRLGLRLQGVKDPLKLIDRVELIPEDGIRVSKGKNYRHLDGIEYECLMGMVRENVML